MVKPTRLPSDKVGMDVGAYREYLTALGRSDKTIYLYTRALMRAETAVGDLGQVTAVDLAAYADTLPYGYATRKHLQSALKAWWQMTDRPDGPHLAVRVPQKPRGHCHALTEADAHAMVKTAVGWYPEGLAALFGFYLALRSSEIARAHTDRFDSQRTWYTVSGKFGVTATLPVHPILAAEVAASGRTGWLFPGSRDRTHVTPMTIWNWIRSVAAEAEVDEDVWPHRLRHTALATANDTLGDLRAVMTFARHADPSSTLIYTRTTNRRLQEVADSLDYL